MKTKLILIGLTALFLGSCEVKETNNYDTVKDPLIRDSVNNIFGYWESVDAAFKYVKAPASGETPEELSANGISFTPYAKWFPAIILPDGSVAMVFNRGNYGQSGIDLVQKEVMGLFLGKANGTSIKGKFYEHFSKNAGDTINFEGNDLEVKSIYDTSIKFNYAVKTPASDGEEAVLYDNFSEKAALEIKIGDLGTFKGDATAIQRSYGTNPQANDITAGAINIIDEDGKHSTNYSCNTYTDFRSLDKNTFTFSYPYTENEIGNETIKIFTTNEIKVNYTASGGWLAKQCSVDFKLKNLNNTRNHDPMAGIDRLSYIEQYSVTGSVTDCTSEVGNGPVADDYRGYAMAFARDKKNRFVMYLVSDKLEKDLIYWCSR